MCGGIQSSRRCADWCRPKHCDARQPNHVECVDCVICGAPQAPPPPPPPPPTPSPPHEESARPPPPRPAHGRPSPKDIPSHARSHGEYVGHPGGSEPHGTSTGPRPEDPTQQEIQQGTQHGTQRLIQREAVGGASSVAAPLFGERISQQDGEAEGGLVLKSLLEESLGMGQQAQESTFRLAPSTALGVASGALLLPEAGIRPSGVNRMGAGDHDVHADHVPAGALARAHVEPSTGTYLPGWTRPSAAVFAGLVAICLGIVTALVRVACGLVVDVAADECDDADSPDDLADEDYTADVGARREGRAEHHGVTMGLARPRRVVTIASRPLQYSPLQSWQPVVEAASRRLHPDRGCGRAAHPRATTRALRPEEQELIAPASGCHSAKR